MLAGTTPTDGEVYVARHASGEAGKLNMNEGLVWHIWAHTGGKKEGGDVFLAHDHVPVEWVPVSKGDPLPQGAVYAGHTKTDGDVYVVRDEHGAAGKLNVDAGRVHNVWCHGQGWFALPKGEVLVVHPGILAPLEERGFLSVAQLRDDEEMTVFIRRVACSMDRTLDPKLLPEFCQHFNGRAQTKGFSDLCRELMDERWGSRPACCPRPITPISWKVVTRGDSVPEGALCCGETQSDGRVFVARHLHGKSGKLNLDEGKVWNIWVHGVGSKRDGEVLSQHVTGALEWVPIESGQEVPEGAIQLRATRSGPVKGVGRSASNLEEVPPVCVAKDGRGAPGFLTVQQGRAQEVCCHGRDPVHSGEVLVAHIGATAPLDAVGFDKCVEDQAQLRVFIRRLTECLQVPAESGKVSLLAEEFCSPGDYMKLAFEVLYIQAPLPPEVFYSFIT